MLAMLGLSWHLTGKKLSTLKGVLITMAAFSVGLVAGGWVGTATEHMAGFEGKPRRQYRHPGRDTAAPVKRCDLGERGFDRYHLPACGPRPEQSQRIEFSIVLLVLGLLAVGGVLALRSPEPATRLVVWLAGRWAASRCRPFTPDNTIASVRHFVAAWESLRNGHWLRPLIGAIANIGFDMPRFISCSSQRLPCKFWRLIRRIWTAVHAGKGGLYFARRGRGG